MKHIINIKETIGETLICEDALLIKNEVMSNLENTVVLDFQGITAVSTTFFYCLLSELLYNRDRNYILEHIEVKNLSNEENFKRVVNGTAA